MHREFYNLNHTQTLLIASSHLSGRANTWYRNVEKQTDAPTTWDGFKQILINKFRPENAELLARDCFSAITQTTTVQDYVNQFMDICLMLPNITYDECCDKFIRGMKSNCLRAELIGRQGTNRTI